MEETWSKFEDKLRSFILSKVHDESVTEDLLQDLFIKIHANIHTVRDESRLSSWIFQICRNLITDHYRTSSAKKDGRMLPEPVAEESEENYMSEALADMVSMMDELPPEYCDALCQTDLGMLSQKEYAMKIGISYSGVKSRVQRARKMLKEMLMTCCHYEFDRYGTVIDIHPIECCCCHPK